MNTYYIWTIGCQMNVADSRRLAEYMEDLGFQRASRMEDADLMVLNTCVVRQSAEDKVLGRLNSLKPVKQRRPGALLVLMGCFVEIQDHGHGLREDYPFVDLFLSPSDTSPLVEMLRRKGHEAEVRRDPSRLRAGPVSAYSTVIHGCNNFCSFCIVPYRRGREASRPVSEIVSEIDDLVANGAREITLLGQNVDSYGRDLPGRPSLADLLEAVHELDGLWRIRFLTSHPKDMSLDLIRTAARLPKVCEHVELPVQAGDDEILRRMNRHYTADHYLSLIRAIREAMPTAGLATDVIVGFPGETPEQFDRTYALLEEVRFDTVHVARYSPRSGTSAASWDDDVLPEEKERRRKAVETLQERVAGEINAQLLNRTVEVLVETLHKGKWRGRTRTGKLVFFADEHDWRGRLAQVRITWAGPWSMQGTVDEQSSTNQGHE